MKLSNVVVMCLSALLGLLMICFTVIACTMVVNWSAPDEAAILDGKVCSAQVFNSDYEVEPLADGSAPAFSDMDANADFDLVIDGAPNDSFLEGVWFLPVVPLFVPGDGSEYCQGWFYSYAFPSRSYLYFEVSMSDGVVSSIIYDDEDFSRFQAYDSSLGWSEVGVRLLYFTIINTRSLSSSDLLLDVGAVKVSDSLDYEPVVVADEPEEPEKGSMVSQVTDVFEGLGVWIADNFGNVMLVFYDTSTSQLTLLGILAAAALAVSVFFLLMGIIQNFLHFKG